MLLLFNEHNFYKTSYANGDILKENTVTFYNNEEVAITVILEPWAEEFNVEPNGKVTINISCVVSGAIEIMRGAKHTSIWPGSGCTAKVNYNGEDVTPPALGIPCPE
jgi:hypothetical protein